MVREVSQVKEAARAAATLRRMEEGLSLIRLAAPGEDREIDAGFASDVLSDVLARAPQGCVLVTAQSNMNVVAVASYVGIAAIIVTSGHLPAEEVIAKAGAEGIGLYSTDAPTFDVVGALSRIGIKGRLRNES